MLLGFKKRFKPKIENGSKIFTLRVQPKRMPKKGETIYMYTGLRTRNCEFITNMHNVVSYQKAMVKIKLVYGIGKFPIGANVTIKVDKENVALDLQFAINDGFIDTHDFVDYWTDGFKHDVSAKLIMFHWTSFKY